MAAPGLADHAILATDPFSKKVLEKFAQQSDILSYLPFKPIEGIIEKYRQQETLPVIQTRRVGQSITQSNGRLAPRQEDLSALAGELFLDDILLDTQRSGGDSTTHLAEQTKMFMRAMGREMERQIFEGDKLVSTDEVLGLRARLTGNQVQVPTGATGATLTLAMLDTLIDCVDASCGPRSLWMNTTLQRKLSVLVRTIGTSVQVNWNSPSEIMSLVTKYEGIDIHKVEDHWDRSSVLDFDEDPGNGTATCASIYVFAKDEDIGFCGLINGDGPFVSLKEAGVTPPGSAPGKFYRTKAYFGTRYASPRSAGRLRGILNQ